MFKSTLTKYLTAFFVVILVSFIALSSIITTTIRSYVNEERGQTLSSTAESVALMAEYMNVESLENYVNSGVLTHSLIPLINRDKDINIILTDTEDKILLITKYSGGDENRNPIIGPNLGLVDLEEHFTRNEEGGFYEFVGTLESVSDERIQVCAKEIITKNTLRGYVMAYIPTDKEDAMVAAARRAVAHSSLWVMLAAVVAVYFITERIIQPLKNMTGAAKSFAKGDFSARVTVFGQDEVAQLAAAFNNMAESVESLEKMRNSFLANVSHDLRTPMTTISGFIDGITSGAIPPEKHEYYLGIISAEVHRLSRLVTDLLDVSRLESGDRKFSFESFDVAEVARIILISFEKQIEEKRLDIIFEAENDEMQVIADKDAVHQVIYNLCHNAIKFSKEGGKLAISLTYTEQKKVRVSVYDEGQSISREDLPFVFDRFYKTDKSRGLDKSGVGLGLYICKTIMDAHGESIYAESPSEDGAEFWFTLKMADSAKHR